MSKKTFNFKDDLKKGLEKEKEFQKLFPITLFKSETFKHDFLMPDESTLELKSDNYDTGNFFFERFSSVEKQSPGGPWQSHSDYFVYWFTKTNVYYAFETVSLVQFLNDYIKNKKPKQISVKNEGYTSVGYLVPIVDCESEFLELAETIEETILKNGASLG